MCSNLDEDHLNPVPVKKSPLRQSETERGCKKCENKAFVLLQGKDPLCGECLFEYCSHKFKATIGKSKLVKSNDRVLVAFSGGAASSAMVDMVKQTLEKSDQQRKLFFCPSLIHVDESVLFKDNNEDTCRKLSQAMVATGWKCYVTSLEMVYRDMDDSFYCQVSEEMSCFPLKSQSMGDKFTAMLSSLKSLTSKEEFIRRMRIKAVMDVAIKEGFQQIFMGSTGTRLSIQLLTDVAQGKGNQIHLETGFCDNRFGIPILKPMRGFVTKEILFYNKLRNVEHFERPDLATKMDKKASLGKMTEAFVTGLQTDFPSTVYTIFKIATKLRPSKVGNKTCILCDSNIDAFEAGDCSAEASLMLSRQLGNGLTLKDDTSSADPEVKEGNALLSSLCYGCSLIVHEMKVSADEVLPRLVVKRALREDVQEFLIEDE